MANTVRPTVNVYDVSGKVTGKLCDMPDVFKAPVRIDLVDHIHNQMRNNSRHPFAVSLAAGHQTSAESWGTGRAVARIPRVRGGGTHRSGQAAYGNMCRGGHMFGAKKLYKRWFRKINVQQKRYAICSAIAATGSPQLSLARGHAVETVPEFPLVLDDSVQELKKTKAAKLCLMAVGAWSDILKVYKSKKLRAGKGKSRNRRTVQKRGPVVVYSQDNGISRAFRNIPGITLMPVDKLNLLKLAPGGHVGRFVIWTESAFKKLNQIYGSFTRLSVVKKGFHLPRPIIKNTDVTSILNNPAIQAVIRPRKMKAQKKTSRVKKNPIKNSQIMVKLNPYAIQKKRALHKAAAKKLQKAKQTIKKSTEKTAK